MKDYIMLFYGTPYHEMNLSQEDLQERMGKWFAWGGKMKAQGILKGGEALTYDTRRVIGKNRTVSDAPFAESKEMVGGYYVVSAESFEAAIEIAQDYPDYDLDGSVEIREIQVFEQ